MPIRRKCILVQLTNLYVPEYCDFDDGGWLVLLKFHHNGKQQRVDNVKY